MALELKIADDFKDIVDWLRPIRIGDFEIEQALRRAVTIRDAGKSGGRYTTSDTVFHIDFRDVGCCDPTTILPGDTIEDEDGVWTILESAKQTLLNRWRMVARQLRLPGGAPVEIQAAKYAKSATGAQEPTWKTVDTVNAVVQIDKAVNNVNHQSRNVVHTARVLFDKALLLDQRNRIVTKNGMVLKVRNWMGFSQIDHLFVVECEVSKWPQA